MRIRFQPAITCSKLTIETLEVFSIVFVMEVFNISSVSYNLYFPVDTGRRL